jgi:protease-4
LSGSRRPEDIPAEEQAMVQELIDDTFTRFKEIVAEGRGRAASANGSDGRALANGWEDYADGRILTGEQAYDLGFVDELGGLDVAVERAKNLAGIRTANLVMFQQRFTLASFLGILGKSEAQVIKLDLGIEAPDLKVGQPYFLSPIYLQ